MNWSTMNGVNQTRQAMGGMHGTRAPRPGLMSTTPQNLAQPAVQAGQMPAMPQQGFRQTIAQNQLPARPPSPNDGVVKPMPVQSAVPPQAGPGFDPNDPRNAALAGYMNGT